MLLKKTKIKVFYKKYILTFKRFNYLINCSIDCIYFRRCFKEEICCDDSSMSGMTLFMKCFQINKQSIKEKSKYFYGPIKIDIY